MNYQIKERTVFITLLLIFAFTASFQILLLTPNLKSPDFATYFLVSTGVLFSLKAFTSAYANISYSISKKKWAVMGIDIIFTLVQFAAIFQAIISLTQNSFPQDTFLWFIVSEVAYNLQILLGKLSSILKVTFWSILIYAAGYFTLNYRIFDAAPEFINILNTVSLLVAIIQLFIVYRALSKSQIIKI
jgi:hypothetical protein